ncbi:MAG: hypothetical protein K2X50_09745 [Gammaproteobacteria bacterium]|nr:hypothetical protein [Gammaproteobacteria bacterium]
MVEFPSTNPFSNRAHSYRPSEHNPSQDDVEMEDVPEPTVAIPLNDNNLAQIAAMQATLEDIDSRHSAIISQLSQQINPNPQLGQTILNLSEEVSTVKQQIENFILTLPDIPESYSNVQVLRIRFFLIENIQNELVVAFRVIGNQAIGA